MIRGLTQKKTGGEKDMKVKLISIFVVMMVLGTLNLFILAPAVEAKPISLRFAFPYLPTDPSYKSVTGWAKEIENRSNGRVKITVYPGGALFKARDTYDSVVKGVADLALGSMSYTPGRFPVMECLEYAPGAFTSSKAGSLGENALFAKYKPKELKEVRIFGFIATTLPRFMTKKPVRTLEDLKGMQIRSTGSRKALVQSLGALSIGMPMSESYDALQKGIVEGIITTTETLVTYRLNEVVQYVTDVPMASAIRFILGNLTMWNSLPADIQKIFTDASGQEFILGASNLLDVNAKTAVEKSEKAGLVKVIRVSSEEQARWVKATRPIVSARAEKLASLGLPGREILDDLYKWGKTFSEQYPE